MVRPRINYIEQINGFWKESIIHSFQSKEIALYFYLLHVNNLCNWKPTFNHNNKKLQAMLDISFKTLVVARSNLKNAGLINFTTKNGSPNVEYSMTTLSKIPEVKNEVRDKVSGVVKNGVRDDISKTKKKQNNSTIDAAFYSYLETIQSDSEKEWRDSIYTIFSLSKGSLKKLLEEFKLSQLSEGKETLDGTLKEFKKHFRNWLNKIDNLGKLDKYKDLKNRKDFGL